MGLSPSQNGHFGQTVSFMLPSGKNKRKVECSAFAKLICYLLVITSKRVMFLPVFVSLFVCVLAK